VFIGGDAKAGAARDLPQFPVQLGKVMGFSHEKTTTAFYFARYGGLIEVGANDLKDMAGLDQIRNHFQHIVHMFAEGNFNAPMLIHSQDVPGTGIMTRLN
jgi:hypothetical protein